MGMDDLIERRVAMKAVRCAWLAAEALEKIPAVDAVKVVRCKDCQFWQRHTQVNRDYGKCGRFGTVTTRCNDFCSLGAKKSEE